MDEAGRESLLHQTAKGGAPVVCKGNIGESDCGGLSTEDMENKENFCKDSENGLDSSATYKAMPLTRRALKGGGCNLRKSLVWNKAFFTEEGVLDPLEMSMLSGSATKSNVSLLNGINGEISPLTSYGVSTRVSSDSKARQVSAFDDKKYGGSFSTLESPGHKDSVLHMVPEKATLSKGICRSIPRTPSASSQKRLANTNTSKPASKLPRFTATRSQTSSLFPNSRCSDLTTGHPLQNAKPANIEPNAGTKGSLLTPNKALNYSNSSSRNSQQEEKTFNETSELPPSADIQTSDMGKSISHLSALQSQLPSNMSFASVGSSNSGKNEYSFSQNAQHFQGGRPLKQGQGKPSCLRMPTPSLGFFCQFNETSEFPPSADIQTSDMGKSISHLSALQSQLPSNMSSASVGSSNSGKNEYSFSQNAQHFQGGRPPKQGQGKPSCLRMPTPSLGFFCQAKIPSHGLQTQGSKKNGAFYECNSQSLKTSRSLKHTDDFKTLHASQRRGQPGGSEPAGTKACAISTTISSKNAGYTGNLLVPSVTKSTLNKDMDKVASNRKLSRSATKPQVACCRKNDEDKHSCGLVDEDNMQKQTSSQGSGCEPESPQHLVSLADNSLLPVGRKLASTSKQNGDFEDADGIYLASENSGNVIMQNCSSKQLQQGDCGIGESLTCEQLEESRETSISAGNECSPDGKHDSLSCLSFENNDKVVDRSSLLEIKTSLSYSKLSLAGSTSTLQFHSYSEKLVPVVEGVSREHTVHGLGQCRLDHDTILSEEAHDAKKSDQHCEVSVLRKENQLASQDKSEAVVDKQEAFEKPEKVSISLNQLKAVPFSDEWLAAMESFGEDILQIQTGAVQNSPPDKPNPEVGPWSPVKRKNQDIGPYDCTKYGKSMSAASNQ